LIQAPAYSYREPDALERRHERLADWGFADSQYWLGRKLDPCRHPELAPDQKSYLDAAGRARYWYGKAAAQNMPEAGQDLARLDSCKVPAP
jgi:hypothetical protein